LGEKKSWSSMRSTLGWGATLVGGSITFINIVSLWQVVLKLIHIPIGAVGFNPRNVFSWIEKDDDLIELIWVNKFLWETFQGCMGCLELEVRIHQGQTREKYANDM
jgi:hypothetical protein